MPFGSLWSASKSVPIEPEEYIDAGGDRVVLLHRLAAQGGGISLERQDGIVYLCATARSFGWTTTAASEAADPPSSGEPRRGAEATVRSGAAACCAQKETYERNT